MFTTIFLILTAVSESLVWQSLSYSRTDSSESQTNSWINVWQFHKGSREWFHKLKIKKNIAGKFTVQSWLLDLAWNLWSWKVRPKAFNPLKKGMKDMSELNLCPTNCKVLLQGISKDSRCLMNDPFPGESTILSLSPKCCWTHFPQALIRSHPGCWLHLSLPAN